MPLPDLTVMIGKTVLVGVTYIDSSESVVDELQFAGVVLSVDPLVTIHRGDLEPFTLPPERAAFDVAPPGEYRLRSTVEIVVDPDFVTSWTVSV